MTSPLALFNPWSSHTKDIKNWLTLSIIMYGSTLSGAIQELRPRLLLGVVPIEKGAFSSPSTRIDQLLYIYICVCVCVYDEI